MAEDYDGAAEDSGDEFTPVASADDFPDTLPPDAFARSKPKEDDFPDTLPADHFRKAAPENDGDFPDALSDRQFQKSPFTSTPGGAAVRGAAEEAAPAVGGLGAGIAAGSQVAGALSPAGPVVAGLGGIAAGLAVGMGAGAAIHWTEDKLIKALGLDQDDSSVFSERQARTDQAQHKYAREIGAVAPAAVLLRPTGTLAQRAIGAGIGGVATAGQQLYENGEIDPISTLIGAGAGAAFPNPNALGAKFERAVPTQAAQPGETRGLAGPPDRPLIQGPDGSPERPLTGEVVEPEVQQVPYRNDGRYASQIEQAIAERNKFKQDHIGYRLWNEQVERLQSQEDGKGWADVDASQGPRSEDNPFTWQDADLANDVTTTAKGVAAENGPAPKVKGAGNPIGAPMEARQAARPSDPNRNYAKDARAADEGVQGAQSTKISSAPIHEDLAAALAHEQPPKPSAQDIADRLPRPMPEPRENALSAPLPEPRENALPAPAPEPHVTATETKALAPHEVKLVEDARSMLQEKGMTKALELMDRVQDPARQAKIAAGVLSNLQSKTGEAKGQSDVARQPKRRTEVEGMNGVLAASKPQAEHKAGVLQAHHEAVARFGQPADGETPVSRRARLQQLSDAVDTGTKKLVQDLTAKYPESKKFFTGSYKPREKSAAMLLVKAARSALKVPSAKNIEALQAAEAGLKGEKGKAAAEEDFKRLVQETQRIDAEIDKKPSIPDAAAETMIQRAHGNEATLSDERIYHKEFDNSKQLESTNHKTDHDSLVNWLNQLTDEDHALLVKEHPDLHLNVEGTNQPSKLMKALQDDLIAAEQKAAEKAAVPREAEFEAAAGEDQPVVKRTRITSRDDLNPTKPGEAAGPGKVLDKNSPEFKRLAEEALANNKGPSGDRLAAERERRMRERLAENETRTKLEDFEEKPPTAHDEDAQQAEFDGEEKPATLDDGEKSFADFAKDFFKDTSGAVPVPDWAKRFTKYMWGPHADPGVIDYAKTLGAGHTKMRNYISQAYRNALVNARLAMAKGGYRPTPHEFGQMYRAIENRTRDQLPAKMQNFMKKFIDPVYERAGQTYDQIREASIRLKLKGWEDMPERKTNGAGFADFMYRRLKLDERAEDINDPITNRSSLSNWAQSAMERDWYVMQNLNTGERRVYHVNADGNVVFYKNHKAGAAKTMPASFDPRDIGAELMQGANRVKVDHAKIDELMTHGNGKDGKPLRYSDNLLYVVSDAYVGLKAAHERVKLLDKIMTDPEFQGMRAKNKTEADAKFGAGNHAETILPQFAGAHFPKPLAWALDDMVKTGFDYKGSVAADRFARFSGAMLKPFYFLGPEVHVLNELDKFIVGRGLWNNTIGLPRLAKHFVQGLRSVRAQDAMQKDIVQAGGNQMFVHSMVSRVSQQIGKLAGEDMVAKPWKYDPLKKVFGLNTKELGQAAMRGSNKFMWWQSDVLYSTMFSENRAKLGWKDSLPEAEKQRINREAVQKTEHVIDSYVVPTTFGKTLGLEHTDAGRALQKVLTDPITSAFGRYHYGVFHMLSQVVKSTLHPDSTPAQRWEGANQAAMLMVMASVVYPALSKAYAALTGDKHSELEQRGLTRMVTTPFRSDKSMSDVARSIWTPAPAFDTTMRLAENKDFTGKKQFDASGGYGRVPGQAADFALGQFASPLAAASRGYMQKGAGFAGQKFLESNFGLKTPSPKAEKYEASREQYRNRDAIQRERSPRGVFESMNNQFIKRR